MLCHLDPSVLDTCPATGLVMNSMSPPGPYWGHLPARMNKTRDEQGPGSLLDTPWVGIPGKGTGPPPARGAGGGAT